MSEEVDDRALWEAILRALIMMTRAVLEHKLHRDPSEVFVKKIR